MYNAYVISIVFKGGVQIEADLSAEKEAEKRSPRFPQKNVDEERT
jgi:hypothetical protein